VCAWDGVNSRRRLGRRLVGGCLLLASRGRGLGWRRVDCCEEGQKIRRARGVVVRRVRARWMMKDVGMVRGAVSCCVMRGLRRMVSVRDSG
jgi:hypothetical protein